MKTIKYLMLAFVAAVTCVSFSSCSKEEDYNKGIGNYYLQLYDVETNLIDANGNSFVDALYDEWVIANNADSNGKKVIGKTDNETARAWFNSYISSFIQVNDKAFAGKNRLPDGGYVVYHFSLDSNASFGGARESASIEITNTGARRRR